jgi:hypothetical protein
LAFFLREPIGFEIRYREACAETSIIYFLSIGPDKFERPCVESEVLAQLREDSKPDLRTCSNPGDQTLAPHLESLRARQRLRHLRIADRRNLSRWFCCIRNAGWPLPGQIKHELDQQRNSAKRAHS